MSKLRSQQTILLEGLEYMDLKGEIFPIISIDEYKATADDDDELITLTFVVNGELQANDLSDWFSRGYDWVTDSQPSDGEVMNGKFLVFVEIPRRSSAPQRIIELIDDLETLTDLSVEDWTLRIQDQDYELTPEIIKKHIALSPQDYRESHDETLNEWRVRAGIEPQPLYSNNQDAELLNFKSLAGL